MTVRCLQCGQENNPQYRFCGVCGAPLGPPPQAAAPTDQGRERVRVPVSGPSFLGLGDERSRDLDYLLEDEPPRGRGRLYLALLLLIVSGALLAWQWQREGYPWSGYIPKPTASTSAPVNSPPAPPPDSAAAAAPVVPVQPTANPAAPEAQPTTSAAVPPPASEPAGSAPANTSAAARQAETTSSPPASRANDAPNSGEAAAKAPAAAPSQVDEPEAAEPTPKETRVAPAVQAPRSVSPKPSPALTSQPDSFEDRLVADGEKYLYGRGVPEDCARAQRNLQIGARQSNARAQTLLGAMYATGHCVSRDLPTAYRWFAKALHGDPGNSRVQRDLEVLWNQMTPEERRLAMKSQ
jgi:hypothetical protein